MLNTVGNDRVLARLVERVNGLTPESERRWGKMNVVQMLSHVGRSMDWVVRGGEAQPDWDDRPSKAIKFLAFRIPLPWPKGIPNPNDPASADIPADEFESLRALVVRGLEQMSSWEVSENTPPHPAFGPLTTWEWQRWAYKHADHHLKQFSA